MNVSTSENFAPHSGNERVVDLDHLDDFPLQKPDTGKDVLGDFDILRGQLDPEEREKIFSSARRPTEIIDMEVASNPDSESEDHVLEKINHARADKDFSTVYELVKKIDDDALMLTVVRGVVADLVDVPDYDTAKKFVFLIKDPDIYARELSYILEHQNDVNNPLEDFEPQFIANEKKETSNEALANSDDEMVDFKPDIDSAVNQIKIKKFPNKTTGTEYIDTETGDFVSKEKVEDNSERDIPTAVELAMKKADELVSKSDTTPAPEVVPPIPVVEASGKSAEEINEGIEKTREEYASQLVEWKNQIRSKKSKFRKVLADLGVDKQLPSEEEPKELVEARKAYTEAKKAKYKDYLVDEIQTPNRDQRPLGLLDAEVNSKRYDLMDMLDSEDEAFGKRISDALPPLEKGMLGKGLDMWRAMPRYQRIAISSGLAMTAGLIGGAGVGAAAVYGGMRAGRAVLGTLGAQGVAGAMGSKYEDKNASDKKEALSTYTKNIDLDNFDRKEKERMDFVERKQKEMKRQTLKKGLAMAATVGVTNLGLTIDGPSAGSMGKDINLPGKGTLNVPNDYGNIDKYLEKLDNTKSAVKETLTSDNQLDNLEQFKPVVESSIEKVAETEVLPVPETVIKGLHNLKAEIMSEYGGEVPESLKPIMDKTPKELATIFDLNNPANIDFDPSLASENISVGSDGNVYYEHQDGSKQTLFDSKAGKFYRFDGTVASETSTTPLATSGTEVLEGDPIFKTEAVSVLDVKDTTDEEIAREAIERVSIPEESEVAIADEKPVAVPGEVDDRISVGGDKSVEVLTVGENKFVSYEGMRIGQEITQNGKKLFVLDDNFQDGEQYAPVRNAFTKAFEKSATVSVLGPNPIAESFEGGKIYISYNVPNDPDSVKILLNGKEIASGSTTVVDAKGIPKIKMYGNLKGGWFLVDNAYERAFKHIDKMIKAGTFDFKK